MAAVPPMSCAQLVARGLNSVGGGGTSRASGRDTTRRPVGGKPREQREPAWALSHVATVWGQRARGHGRGSRPGVDHREGRACKSPRAQPAGRLRPTASVIFADSPRSEAAPIVDARRWPIRAPSCPDGSSRWISESRPPGLALSPCATLRGAERARPAPWGPLVSEGPTSEVDGPWPHSRFPVLGRANGTDPAPPESIRSNKPSNTPQEHNCSTTPTPTNTSHHVSILPNQRGHTDN